MFNFVLWVVVGAIIGGLVSMVDRVEDEGRMPIDIAAGIFGGFIGGLAYEMITHGTEVSAFDAYSTWGLVVAASGAAVVVAVANVFRQRTVR